MLEFNVLYNATVRFGGPLKDPSRAVLVNILGVGESKTLSERHLSITKIRSHLPEPP